MIAKIYFTKNERFNHVCSIILLIFLCSFSNGFAQDTEKPEPPVIKYATVDTATGFVSIYWLLSQSPDVRGYLVYRNQGSVAAPIWIKAGDTIEDPNADSYYDTGAEANLHPESYRVISIDSTGNTSLMSPPHTTIYAFPYLHDKECPPYILLDWSAYSGWSDSIEKYKIYHQHFPGSFSLLDNVAGNIFNYYYYNILDSTKYCFYLEACHKDGQRISRSNITCGVTELYKKPKYLNNNFVTVAGYNRLDLSFTIDTMAESMKNYTLMRAGKSGEYFEIKTFPSSSISVITLTDTLDIFRDSYSYKMTVKDLCDNVVFTSNPGNNIVLHAETIEDYNIKLSWNRYSSFYGGIKTFNIYRIIDHGSPALITIGSTDDTIFIDNIDTFIVSRSGGDFCYYVEIHEDSNPYFNGAFSRSNIACASIGPVVYIPNAFTPNNDHVNDIFQPFVSFASPENYIFIVYNRWGFKMFETRNPLEGWDGKTGNKTAPCGTYVYYMKFTTAENKIFEKSGYFTLLNYF